MEFIALSLRQLNLAILKTSSTTETHDHSQNAG
jgi:hypothetical protein